VLRLDGPGLLWAAPQRLADVLAQGDVVRIVEDTSGHWRLAQTPAVDGALISLDPRDGAVRALVGGLDFFKSNFNRVTQAQRQPGSNFKPFLYSAALEKGFTPASLINDAPVVFEDDSLEATWRPENYSGEVFGPTRLREALVNSRNLVSIRLLRAMEIPYAIDYVGRFGFDKTRLPRDLSLALGSAAMTPLEIVTGYAVFANGGYRVMPYFIDTIEDAGGSVVYRATPDTVCGRCEEPRREYGEDFEGPPRSEDLPPVSIAPRVLTPQNVYLMRSMMGDVIRHGTGRRALELRRSDLAGKTGTTNDQHDAWFSGFTPALVTTTWVGFDQPKSLGDNETGGRAALPMWIDFMREGLKDLPILPLEQPPGLVTVRIDPETGLLAGANNPKAIFETFRAEQVPEAGGETSPAAAATTGTKAAANTGGVAEELF
jgi:penicillin-binding protein 1A